MSCCVIAVMVLTDQKCFKRKN